MANHIEADLAAVARIDAVPTILDVVCRTTKMGFAAVAKVTDDRWVACAVRDEISFGLQPGGELELGTTICREVRDRQRPIVIDHVAEDEIFRKHPTPAKYGFQSYISVPIFRPRSGSFFGTLCAIDPRPARLNTPETVGMFRLFADLIGFHLDALDRLAATEAALADERERTELGERFIAVLGHDLRNPLGAIMAGTSLLRREALSDVGAEVLVEIQASADRMARLISDVLDFARGRLGGGLELSRDDAVCGGRLASALEQVVAELRAAWTDRVIETRLDLRDGVRCDRDRVAQLLSNLLANALTHGSPDAPVRVRASSEGGAFELSVANGGDPIPPDTLERLFQPFFRASGRRGLGLGLYIAAEIARAHGGELDVASTPAETRFTFRMPAPGAGATRSPGGAPRPARGGRGARDGAASDRPETSGPTLRPG